MKTVRYKSSVTREELIALLRNNDAVNKNVRFDEKRGTPHIHVRENGDKIKLTCEYMGGATKDNAFISGTSFSGKIRECEGGCEIKGVITTAPIFHTVLLLMFAVFIAMCIIRRGFNVVPICLLAFDIFMYKDEFRKQGIIDRYIARAVRRAEGR